jgi:hypothetical protein
VIQCEGIKIGLVGLNSTWLQLENGDYQGRLQVDVKQLLAVTGDDPVAWCSGNDVNVLLTHHPATWFSPSAQIEWDGEINPPGRFAAHLFGHMHVSDSITTSRAGGLSKISIQGSSLFGLEKSADGIERIHGYSLAATELGSREIKIWPRRLRRLKDGSQKLGPDFSFDLDEDNSCFLGSFRAGSTEKQIAPQAAAELTAPRKGNTAAILDKIRYHIPQSKAHKNVRRIEQKKCSSALETERVVWLFSAWGMGAEGFLWSVQSTLSEDNTPTYRLDLQDFGTREHFLSSVQDTLDCSFQALCDVIADQGRAYIFLDEAPAGREPEKGSLAPEQELESIIRIMLDFCPKARIVVRSRLAPRNISVEVVDLKPLDEADILTYVTDSEFGGAKLATSDVVADLYRITDGAPSRLDAALHELQVVAISDLIEVNSDFAQKGVAPIQAPPALVQAVAELSSSSDPTLKRAFELLKALSAFPQGEQLQRIKRFHGTHAFFVVHAKELMGRSLLKSLAPQETVADESRIVANTLVVPRPVREYVRGLLSSSEVTLLDRKALALYFGDKWASGEIRTPSGHRFDDPHRATYEIANASTIVVRFLRSAFESSNTRNLESGVRISSAYANALESGDHYRSASTLCQDVLAVIPDSGYERQRSILKYQLASNLRMTGNPAQARDTLLAISLEKLPTDTRVDALLELALCHDVLGEVEAMVQVARQIKKLARGSFAELQAEALILEGAVDDPARDEKLSRLAVLCRRRGASVIANNIALTLGASSGVSRQEAEKLANSVLLSARTAKDFYNGVRAVIRLARYALDSGERVSEGIKSQLMTAYHYLFHERGNGFDSCHVVLWRIFSQESDTENLLRLFRTSSFIWRLRRDDSAESEHLKILGNRLGSISGRDFRRVDRELTYYIVRSAALLPAQLLESIPDPAK